MEFILLHRRRLDPGNEDWSPHTKLSLETRAPSDVTPIPSDLLPQYREKIEALQKKAKATINDYKAILKDAKANYMCASACFFIFVAGIEREGNNWPPVLGIHRPYLSDADLKGAKRQSSHSFGWANANGCRGLSQRNGRPRKYADLMFSIPKDQVRFIDEDDFELDIEGYIPELRDWLEAKCNNLTDVEKVVSKAIEGKRRRSEKLTEDDERMGRILTGKFVQQGECHAQALSKLREDAWRQFHGQ